MNIVDTNIGGVFLIQNDVFEDSRGYFFENFNLQNYDNNGIKFKCVQDNISYTKNKYTLRGMHWQKKPYEQAKIVTCLKGSIIDVVVDMRLNSPTFKKWIAIELNDNNHLNLFVPKGLAHGFLTLSDDVIFNYKVDNYYNKDSEIGFRYDDSEININWEKYLCGNNPTLLKRDLEEPFFKNIILE